MIATLTSDKSGIETKKIQLISILAQVYNFEVLEKIENLLLNTSDWWTSVSKAEKDAIDEGLNDIKAGRIISHQQVTQELNNRYKGL